MKWTTLIQFFLCSALVACCSGVNNEDPGDPLLSFNGRIEGSLENPGENSAIQVSLVWENLNAMNECVKANESQPDAVVLMTCSGSLGWIPDKISQPVEIIPSFPAKFKIPVFQLPDSSILTGSDGNFFGQTTLTVYNDGNNNQALDWVSPEAKTSVDTILGTSLYTIFYREGELLPVWRLISLWGYPEPPQGFSIYFMDTSKEMVCTSLFCHYPFVSVPLTSEIVVSLGEVAPDILEKICLANPQNSGGKVFPKDAPPANAQTVCSQDGCDLQVNPYPERYCHIANTVNYSLYEFGDKGWDITKSPPEWWPCEAKCAVTTDPIPIVGTYQATSHTRNEAGCDQEGAAVETGPAFFKLQKNETYSQMFGTDIMELIKCSSATACDAQGDPAWGFYGWSDGAWTGGSFGVTDQEGGKCALYDLRISIVPEEGKPLRIERKELSALLTLEASESCDIPYFDTHKDSLHCDAYEVLVGTLVP